MIYSQRRGCFISLRVNFSRPSPRTWKRSRGAKKRQNPETLEGFGVYSSSGSRIRTDDLRVMSPTSYLAAPSRITLCPSDVEGKRDNKGFWDHCNPLLLLSSKKMLERDASDRKHNRRYTTGHKITPKVQASVPENSLLRDSLWQRHPPSSKDSTQPSIQTLQI